MKFWLMWEIANHRVDAYLARQRGDLEAEKYAKGLASSCLDKLRGLTGRLYV